jgi:cytochrome b subunit of formate dehydrogenase/5-methylcytosine-specific restriction endonuclease McrA
MTLLKIVLVAGLAIMGLRAQEDAACLGCHGKAHRPVRVHGVLKTPPPFDGAHFATSVHGSMGCTSCHGDVGKEHPGKPAARVDCAMCHEEASATYEHSVHAQARKAGNTAAAQCADCHGSHDIVPLMDPASPVRRENLLATCGQCHPDIAEEVKGSVHGQAMARGLREAPSCTDCHSEHAVQALKGASPLKLAQDVCSTCHASRRMNAKLGLPTDRVTTFFDSYHGMAARMGSPTAANCASCHGFHGIYPASDPRSSVNPANLVRTCQKCHANANEKFALGKVHVEEGDQATPGGRINHAIKHLYLLLIFVVIGGMAFHNLLALRRKALASLRDPNRTVVRMTRAARIQHGLLALSFIALVISGFSLKYPDSWLGWLMGSSETFRHMFHRVAAVTLMGLSMGHLVFLVASRQGRTFVRDMLPGRQDVFDVFLNLRHFLRTGAPRPRFKRFTYAEKAEYWAVLWGTAIMATTGLLIWFKMGTTRFMARWVVEVATTIHYYEAVLATLAILVWHFWGVLFDPEVYPMSWAWFDGRITRRHQEHEHPLEPLDDPEPPPQDDPPAGDEPPSNL